MKKPQPKKVIRPVYYEDAQAYIEYLLGIKDLRDVAGKFSENKPEAEYQDFWHVLLSRYDYITEGIEFLMFEDDIYLVPDWAKPIWKIFMQEFKEPGNNYAEFYVEG